VAVLSSSFPATSLKLRVRATCTLALEYIPVHGALMSVEVRGSDNFLLTSSNPAVMHRLKMPVRTRTSRSLRDPKTARKYVVSLSVLLEARLVITNLSYNLITKKFLSVSKNKSKSLQQYA
jgi:hypothetical protein